MQTRRSMLRTYRTFSAFDLREDCGFHVHERITHCLRESLFLNNPLSLVLRAARIVCASSVSCPCLLGTSSVQIKFKKNNNNNRTWLRWTLSTKYVLRTYNAHSVRNRLTFNARARTFRGPARKHTVSEQRVQVLPP